jgi:hypothetical protein
VEREGRQANHNYCSGEDYVLEFRSFRYGFNTVDFVQRAELAAVQLELVRPGILEEEDLVDLVRLVAEGEIDVPGSGFGEYLLENAEMILRRRGECLVYWLRELVFRGAWMDLRVLEEQVDAVFDDTSGSFVYYPHGNRSREIGPPPHPSWRAVAFAG